MTAVTRLLLVACAALLAPTQGNVCVEQFIGSRTENILTLPPTYIEEESEVKLRMPHNLCQTKHVGTYVQICDNAAPTIIFSDVDHADIYRVRPLTPAATVHANLYCQ